MYQNSSGLRCQVSGNSLESQNWHPRPCDRRPDLLQILFFAMTTAPIIATSNNNEAISKVNM